jgi:hypothetical protein
MEGVHVVAVTFKIDCKSRKICVSKSRVNAGVARWRSFDAKQQLPEI